MAGPLSRAQSIRVRHIGQVVRLRECPGHRHARRPFADDAAGHQVLAAVVADADDFIGLLLQAREAGVGDDRGLALAVRRAQLGRRHGGGLGHTVGRLGAARGFGGWVGGRRCSGRGWRGFLPQAPEAVAVVTALAVGLGGDGGGRLGHRRLFAEQCHANHAHMRRAARAGGIRVGNVGKLEGRYLAVALAPAGDLVTLKRREHIAALVPGRSLAAEYIHAVHRRHGQHPLSQPVAHRDGIPCPGPPCHPVFAPGVVHRQRGAGVTVHDGDISQAANGLGRKVGQAQQCRQGGEGVQDEQTGFHSSSIKKMWWCCMKRTGWVNGVERCRKKSKIVFSTASHPSLRAYRSHCGLSERGVARWRWACWRRFSAAAVLSPTSAPFCCVIWSSWVTATLTCEMPSLCSAAAVLISPMMPFTRCTPCTISFMVSPALATSWVPESTFSTLDWISALISLAASALRCARLRTSAATTAKPRPCSPARAASTAAFSARMLVWNAMPSITPMMSAIFWLLWWMSCMVLTTCCITSPPLVAVLAAVVASWLAWRAESALWRTVAVSSSMLAAVCSRLLAACSVRWPRFWLPLLMSSLVVRNCAMLSRTAETSS